MEWLRLTSGIGNATAGAAVATGPHGEIYVVGTVVDGPVEDQKESMFAARFDAEGTMLWRRVVRTSSDDSGNGGAVDANGNLYIVGSKSPRSPARAGGILVASFRPDGHRRWFKRLGSGRDREFGYAIDVRGGRVFVAGDIRDRHLHTTPPCVGFFGGFVAALTTNGQSLWFTRVIRTQPGDAEIHAMAAGTEGGVVVGMREASCDGEPRTVIVSVDANGVPRSRSEAPGLVTIASLTFAHQAFYLVGHLKDHLDGSSTALVKMGEFGRIYWSRRLTSPRGTDGTGATGLGQGIVVVGSTGDPASDGKRASVVTRLMASGLVTWRFELTGGDNSAAGVAVSGGALYVVGTTSGAIEGQVPEGPYALFLMKLRAK